MIKTKYIIAPYQADPDVWTMRVAFLSQMLLNDMHDLGMPFAVVNVHASIMAGCYGDDSDPQQRRVGMRSTLAQLANVALGPDNELYVITFDDGTASDGMASELRVWKQTRDDMDHPLNVHNGTWQQWLDEYQINVDPMPNDDTQGDTQPDLVAESDQHSEDYTDI